MDSKIARPSPSTTNKNKYDDGGKPCLSPRDGLNISNPKSIIKTTKYVKVTHPIIDLTRCRPNPTCNKSNLRYIHETLLYALDKSSLITTVGHEVFLVECRPSLVVSTVLWISMPLRKPNYSREMNFDNTDLILTTITLAILVYGVLHHDIGLNSSKESWRSTFVINAMKVELKLLDILLDKQISSTTQSKSSPNTSKISTKNSIVKPSRPRLLSFLKEPMIAKSYYLVTALYITMLYSSSMSPRET
jgi:hypothetical protein